LQAGPNRGAVLARILGEIAKGAGAEVPRAGAQEHGQVEPARDAPEALDIVGGALAEVSGRAEVLHWIVQEGLEVFGAVVESIGRRHEGVAAAAPEGTALNQDAAAAPVVEVPDRVASVAPAVVEGAARGLDDRGRG
jgi:hypothetical protein